VLLQSLNSSNSVIENMSDKLAINEIPVDDTSNGIDDLTASKGISESATSDGIVELNLSSDIAEMESNPVSQANIQPNLQKPGYACIKSEFLVTNYKPVVLTEFLSDETKLQIEKEVCTSEAEPPAKKAKLKGRNKHRPRNEKIQSKDKMCPSILRDQVCNYGDKCIFSHDRIEFMKRKPEDLGNSCYLFKTFGKCHYGLTCRFAKSHLSETLENVIDNEIYQNTNKVKAINELTAEVKKKLWKKKYNFQAADSIVKEVNKNFQMKNNLNLQKPLNSEDHRKEALIEQHSESPKQQTDQSNSIKQETPENNLAANKGNTLDERTSCTTELKSELSQIPQEKRECVGCLLDEEMIPLRPAEKPKIDFRNKLYLAPLTTVGNLPFRHICKSYGADITCGEMALSTQLLQGKLSEWSLIKRHPSEDIFGVQLCGAYPDTMTRCAQLLKETAQIDFIDINCGCPIDLICKKGAGSALLSKPGKLEQICLSMKAVMGDMPLTVKLRTGENDGKNVAHTLIPRLQSAGVSLVTLHGRSKAQRYTKLSDWNYIAECAALGMPIYGNGDILSYEDVNLHMQQSGVSGVMIARGALIKPWIFTEIKEERHWDISSGERFDILRTFTNYGLEHWGSDQQGVDNTRRFLLEWLSFLHRYIPVGVLEVVPQRINERPPYFVGRNDLETLMASASCADWIKLSEMLLGPVPDNFHFLPKHKANAYQ
ncbi:tRNA-dihydrouridine(47) synthase [NAD(P)(+)]-like isoform X1, partial [Biomphalaria pfeifferi]